MSTTETEYDSDPQPPPPPHLCVPDGVRIIVLRIPTATGERVPLPCRLRFAGDDDDEEEAVDDSNMTGIPPDRPASAFLDLRCWLIQGCKPPNPEYMEWLLKSINSEYAFSLLNAWQGKGKYERDKWKAAEISDDQCSFQVMDAESYESARGRAYEMLHSWLGEDDDNKGDSTTLDVWRKAELALPLFHECLEEADDLDRINPTLDVSREKVGYISRAAWIDNFGSSREVKDAVADELLLLLIVYELLRDLKRDDEESDDTEEEWSDASSNESDEEAPKKRSDKPSVMVDESEESPPRDDDELASSDGSNECESVCAISTRVHCQGRGARFKAIALTDILLSNTTSDKWEPDLDVDLLKMIVEALGASKDNPLNRKIVLPALSKVLSYWACRPSDFDEDHWDIFRLEILPALQALKKDWAVHSSADSVDHKSPAKRASPVSVAAKTPSKRARRSSRNQKGALHPHHLRSEMTEAFTILKECASSFPAVTSPNEEANSVLSQCIDTLTWMLDEKCLEWMMDSEWRPESTY